MWTDPADDDANIAFTREMATAMKPWTTGRVYINFIGDEGPGRVEAAYGPEKYSRLQRIKRVWDPNNVFRHNQNIPPALLSQRRGLTPVAENTSAQSVHLVDTLSRSGVQCSCSSSSRDAEDRRSRLD